MCNWRVGCRFEHLVADRRRDTDPCCALYAAHHHADKQALGVGPQHGRGREVRVAESMESAPYGANGAWRLGARDLLDCPLKPNLKNYEISQPALLLTSTAGFAETLMHE